MTRIDGNAGLGKAAIEAALKRHAELRASMADKVPAGIVGRPDGAGPVAAKDFAAQIGKGLADGLDAVEQTVRASDGLEVKMLNGEITEFHEIAARLKQADLTYKFALEVRNKLIDAYRETMRMSV